MSGPRIISFRQDVADLLMFGPTIPVGLALPGATSPAVDGVLALVDTGASKCVIAPELADRLSLPVVSRETVGRSGGDFIETNGCAGTLFIHGGEIVHRVALPLIVVQTCHPPHEFILGCAALLSCSLLIRVKTGDIVFQIDD